MGVTSNRVIKNTGFLYAKMGITMFISLYTTRLVLNALGASDFGIFNVVGGAIAMLGFLNAAMAAATQRFMSYAAGADDIQKQTKIFNISVVLHFFISLLVGVVLLIAGWFFFNGILNIEANRIFPAKVVYGSLIVSTIFTVMTVPYDAVLNAHENMLYYSIIGIAESLLKFIIALAVIYFAGDKLLIYGVLMACIPLLTMIIMRVYCNKKYIECIVAPAKYWDKKLMKEMTSFAGWSLMGSASSMITHYGLSIVLNNFFGTILNAAQGIANQISGQLMFFSITLSKAINPVIVKSEGGGDRKKMLNVLVTGSKFSFLLLAFFSIPFIIEAPYIIGIWLKEVPAWAVLFSRLQLARSLIEQFTVMLGGAISAQGDIKGYSITKSILNILPIIFTYILYSYGFPPYYLYVTWIIAGGILGGGLSLYFAKKKCDLSYSEYFYGVFVPASGVSVTMLLLGAIPIIFMESSMLRLIGVIAITSITFCCCLGIFFLTKTEKQLIGSLITSMKKKVKPATKY